MRFLVLTLFFLMANQMFGQVKIGDDINNIDAASILELESDNRAFVPTRMSSSAMNSISPLNGAIVYNTDAECIFVFDGAVWKSLCSSEIVVTTSSTGPTNNKPGDIWINDAENEVSVWDGSDWVLINNGNEFIAQNGLVKTPAHEVELGGELTRPTAIETNSTNTLALEGLEQVDDNSNQVVTVEEATGILRKTSVTSLVQKEEIVVIASGGQNQFTTPLAITNPQKIDVYRNGVKIDFNAVGSNIIELETDVICYQDDEIRIVQFF